MAPTNNMINSRRSNTHRGRGGRSIGVQTGRQSSGHAIGKPFRRSSNFARPNLETAGTKLYLSNLNYKVTNDDIRRLFSAIGKVLRYDIHYDRNGRPGGTAEVLYARRSDALEALKKYNNVSLDGRPVKIDLISSGTNFSDQPRVPVSARLGVRVGANSGGMRVNRRGRGGTRQGGGGGKKKAVVIKSVEDLDKELDAHHATTTSTVAMEA